MIKNIFKSNFWNADFYYYLFFLKLTRASLKLSVNKTDGRAEGAGEGREGKKIE